MSGPRTEADRDARLRRLAAQQINAPFAKDVIRLLDGREAAALDVERLARAMPEDAVIPYSDWNRDTLARHIAAEYARLAAEPSE